MQIKLFSEYGTDSIIQFLNNYSGKKRLKSEWEWEFKSENISSELFVLAEENGQIIGTQALLPYYLRQNNLKILTSKSEETFVHPQYRGKNVFIKMYDFLFKKALDSDIHAIWGFTGAKKPFMSVGFQFFERGLNNYKLIISFARAYKHYSTIVTDSGIKYIIKIIYYIFLIVLLRLKEAFSINRIKNRNYHTKILSRFNKETDELQMRISEQIPELITVDRNQRYMKWRITNNPFHSHVVIGLYESYELLGYAVIALLKNSSEAIIVDVLLKPDHLDKGIKILLKEIIKIGKEKKIGMFSFYLMPCANNYTKKILLGFKSFGFIKSRSSMPFIFKTLRNDYFKECIDINKWYITGIMTEGIAF